MDKIRTFEVDFSGKKLIIEHGRIANQANGAVTAQIGDTVILATATMSKNARVGMDWFPLMVDLEERYSAAGKIKGPRFLKREGRPSNDAILVSRKIDRGLRPLFPQDLRNDIQVICLPLSIDYEVKPDIVAMVAACTALHISNIPFDGPIAGVTIGMVNGDFLVNPSVDELEYADLVLTAMGDGKRVSMVDCHGKEIKDEDVTKAFKMALEAMGPIAKFIDDIRKDIGKEKAKDDELTFRGDLEAADKKVIKDLKAAAMPHLDKYLFSTPVGSKGERKDILQGLKDLLIKDFTKKLTTADRDKDAAEEYVKKMLDLFFSEFIEEQVSLAILNSDKRVDGRKIDQVRPLSAHVGYLPRTHGSAIFSRGETQVMSVVTIGAPGDDLSIETMDRDGNKKYFHHYNFLPFCVGEVKPLRGAGRRDIGHGAMAEKALRPVLPTEIDFPYTVRVVSETMSSNGSSSMAATCGSSLSLMDAGVPIKKHVAGVGMGLASDGKRWKVITDLQDLEDGVGGMDFKFCSTRDGITAIQMDTKTRGLSMDIIEAAIGQMRKGINDILDVMEKVIPEPRPDLSPYAPRIISFMIDPEKIGDVIGPGGKVIRAITDELDVQIDINDDGLVMITSTDVDKAQEAEKIIKEIVRVVKVGDVFEEAEVVKIMGFGAFVKLTPSQDGFVHVSEIEWAHVDKVTDKLKLGDKVKVKVTKIDRGKVDASIRELLPKPEGYVPKPRERRPPRRDSRSGGRDRRGGGRDRRGGGDRRRSSRGRRD